ncbi:MAG: pilus assembly protein PilM [Phycisphaerales bacterium]
MAISMFSNQTSPIAIDFGAAAVKLLQLNPGDPPTIHAAIEIAIPEAIRGDTNRTLEHLSEKLPKALRLGKFKGKRATCSLPSMRMLLQHMQAPSSGAVSLDDYINTQLQIQTGALPGALVVRTTHVDDIYRHGGQKAETICFAIPRDTVMRHIDLLKRCKLEVTGVHTEQHAIVWAFEHLCDDEASKASTTLFVDIGWGHTKSAISHGDKLVFARNIDLGGRHFDEHLAEMLNCDIKSAHAHRMAAIEQMKPHTKSAATGSAILDTGMSRAVAANSATLAPAKNRDPMGEALIEILADELKMGLRYHNAVFENRRVDRVIFIGGESSNPELCRSLAERLRIPAQLGDALGRLGRKGAETNVKLGTPLPGWTVACGLCTGSG